MKKLWRFLGQDRNRAILGWLGGGVVVVAGGLWAAFLHFSDSPSASRAAGTHVEADCGSVAIGGDVRGSTVTASATASDCPKSGE